MESNKLVEKWRSLLAKMPAQKRPFDPNTATNLQILEYAEKAMQQRVEIRQRQTDYDPIGKKKYEDELKEIQQILADEKISTNSIGASVQTQKMQATMNPLLFIGGAVLLYYLFTQSKLK